MKRHVFMTPLYPQQYWYEVHTPACARFCPAASVASRRARPAAACSPPRCLPPLPPCWLPHPVTCSVTPHSKQPVAQSFTLRRANRTTAGRLHHGVACHEAFNLRRSCPPTCPPIKPQRCFQTATKCASVLIWGWKTCEHGWSGRKRP